MHTHNTVTFTLILLGTCTCILKYEVEMNNQIKTQMLSFMDTGKMVRSTRVIPYYHIHGNFHQEQISPSALISKILIAIIFCPVLMIT